MRDESQERKKELGAIRGAWVAQDVQSACSELVTYYEGRSLEAGLQWEPPVLNKIHRQLADGVLGDLFELQGLKARVPRRSGGGLEWSDRGPRGNPEWTRFLNRHDFFRSLLRV